MKKGLVLALGFALISAGLLFAKDVSVPAGFTLATYAGGVTGSGSLAMSFSLAGLGGSAYSEGCDTMNTWFGCQALSSNIDGNWNTAVGYWAL
jgi:hypothetical protein